MLALDINPRMLAVDVAPAAPMIKFSTLQRLVFKITTNGVCNFEMIKMQMPFIVVLCTNCTVGGPFSKSCRGGRI